MQLALRCTADEFFEVLRKLFVPKLEAVSMLAIDSGRIRGYSSIGRFK